MVVGDVATAVDVVVLGAGLAGYSAALTAAQLGKDVVLVEPEAVGGTGLNKYDLPLKLLLTTAQRAWQLRQTTPGLTVERLAVDFAAMQRRKTEAIESHRRKIERQLDSYGVAIAQGKGWFISDSEMRVEGEYGALKFIFEQAIIATGTKPAPLDALPFDDKRVLTPAQVLSLPQLPARLAVIGGDVIAAELATLFAKLDVPTRLIVPAGQSLLADFDPIAVQRVEAQLERLGVEVERGVAALRASVATGGKVVVSAGINPRTSDLKLEAAGVASDERGFIPVNDRLQTNRPHIYAAGDGTGGPPLAALAVKQGVVAAEAIAGQPVQYAPQAIPRVAQTDPELAAVGLMAVQAEALGYDVITAHLPVEAETHSAMFGWPDGLVLIVAEKESHILLGVTLLCPHAADLISEAALAIEMGATLTDLAETIHPYLSLSDILRQVAVATLDKGRS